ncbi:ABC transporter permease [Deinococcus multiflagellatus]|uniref:ABC transporter permease n=1 Tax=Deinococcus multiflagellatus TaxID=1656887 RepID=A0ABW1ZFQ6_9DEIO
MLWLLAFLVLPALIMLGYSFLTRTDLAQVGPPWTLESWGRVIGYDALFQEWTGDNLRVLWRSVWVAGLSTALCVLLGYPLAFYIARQDARRRQLLLLLLIIPFWTNFLIRVYAWIILLRPFDLVPSLTATLLGMVYAFLPFFVLPVYASVEKVNWSLWEAAQDLGAPPRGPSGAPWCPRRGRGWWRVSCSPSFRPWAPLWSATCWAAPRRRWWATSCRTSSGRRATGRMAAR